MSDTPKHNAELNQLYVLRLWRETADAPWRAALCSAAGGKRIAFADTEHLTLFLLHLMEDTASLMDEQTDFATETPSLAAFQTRTQRGKGQ